MFTAWCVPTGNAALRDALHGHYIVYAESDLSTKSKVTDLTSIYIQAVPVGLILPLLV